MFYMDTDDIPEVHCMHCGWYGRIIELTEKDDDLVCPACGDLEIVDYKQPDALDHGGPEWQG